MDKKKGKPKAWQVVKDKELEQVSRRASAAKQGKESKSTPDGSTLVRISNENHKALRIMAAMDGISMQEIIDKLVAEYKAKHHPEL